MERNFLRRIEIVGGVEKVVFICEFGKTFYRGVVRKVIFFDEFETSLRRRVKKKYFF